MDDEEQRDFRRAVRGPGAPERPRFPVAAALALLALGVGLLVRALWTFPDGWPTRGPSGGVGKDLLGPVFLMAGLGCATYAVHVLVRWARYARR